MPFALLVFASTLWSAAGRQPVALEEVQRYLSIRYDNVTPTAPVDYPFTISGPAFIPFDCPLFELSIGSLAQYAPGTKFYTTSLYSPHFEYSRIALLVSARQAERIPDIRSLISPTYREGEAKFMSQFAGRLVAPGLERDIFALQLAELVAVLTPSIEIRGVRGQDNAVTVDLFLGGRAFLEIVLVIDRDCNIRDVLLSSPSGAT